MSGRTASTVRNEIRRHPILIITAGIIAFLILVATLRLVGPLALWAYNVERAGRLMDEGFSWPKPRQVDSLPEVRNNSALDDALGHLSAAIRWRPDHFHAYRLAGRVYAARGDWIRAAEALEQAHERAPENPMPAWEAGLVYEQMVHAIEEAPVTPLVETLANGTIEAPAAPIETPFCSDDHPETCYVGQTTFAQPYAGVEDGDAPATEAPTVFMHPPARVRVTRAIPTDQPALRFLVGLDPAARDWGTDGATFQIWVEPRGEQSELIYQHTVDGATATQGWVAGWADLSPWAGEEVTLVFGVGPNGDGAGDWFGWGDVALTTGEAARYWTQVPAGRMRQAWKDTGIHVKQFIDRGEESLFDDNASKAALWYNRALILNPFAADGWYAKGELAFRNNRWDAALDAYKKAKTLDSKSAKFLIGYAKVLSEGYNDYKKALSSVNKALELAPHDPQILLASGRFFIRNNRYKRAENLLRTAVEVSHNDLYILLELGIAVYMQENFREAITVFRKAATIRTGTRQDASAHVWLGRTYLQLQRPEDALQAFQLASKLNPADSFNFVRIGDVYKELDKPDRAIESYQRALVIDPTNKQALERIADITQ